MVAGERERLLSLSMMFSGSVHVLRVSALPSFLWVRSIPLCRWAAFYDAFIIDGHLGYFHLVSFVNTAAMDVFVQVSVQIPVFKSLGYIRRSGIVLIKIWGKHQRASPSYIPTSNARGLQFLHSLTTVS